MINLSYVAANGILYSNILIFYLFIKLIDILNIQTQYKLLEQQNANQLQHYRDLEISQNETRSLRHDFKNHLLCISELIRTNKNEEADSYIQSVNNVIRVNEHIVYTGNSVLDSLLNAKIMLIKEKKIACDYTIEIPENIKVDPVDVCVIFGNALDNAIEACDRMSSGITKISIVLTYRNNDIVFELTNSTDEPLLKNNQQFLSSKKDFGGHGLGIPNIKRTVEKYNGLLKIENKNDNFELMAILYNV